jgi:hypothetical protein
MRSTGLYCLVSIGPLPLYFVAFFNAAGVAQDHGADLVFFQVQRDASKATLELNEFAGHNVFQTVYTSDTVADRDHRSGLRYVDHMVVIVDFLAQQAGNFICPNLSHKFLCVPGSGGLRQLRS